MGIANLGQTVVNNGIRYGKHKIPRYIYHMTNKTNYESMLKDGEIHTSKELIGEGIFTTELTNFFKRWRVDKSWGFSSLQAALVRQVAKGEDDVVILKIPTENLNHSLLKVRSQNMAFSWVNSSEENKVAELMKVYRKNHPEESAKNWLSMFKYYMSNIMSKKAEHTSNGIPAKDAGKLKQLKHALEYIYMDNIPISNVEKIGEVNVKELRQTAEYDPIRPMRSIFTALLKGNPEVKGAELLNC